MQDAVSVPVSQAFVERLFSVCGTLIAGKHNRMDNSLKMTAWLRETMRFMTAWLKANHDELSDIETEWLLD